MADQKAPQQAAAPPPAQRVEDIPDPDEDDLDDLDDVLDEFSATKLDDKPPAPAAPPQTHPSGPSPPPPTDDASTDADAEFAKQLQAGMAELLGELGQSPDMAQQLEALVKELGGQAGAAPASGNDTPAASSSKSPPPQPSSSSSSSQPPPPPTSTGEPAFQDQIRRTMERMQTSSDSASAAASSTPNTDDLLAQMLAEMEKGGFGDAGADGDGNDEDFSKMLLGMMSQLTHKEILYEPMKELHDKFPGWLAANRGTCGKEDLERYEEQQRCVRAIVERFERVGYSDEDAGDREVIVDMMQKMQAAGSPPPDLVGDMGAAQEALGELDQGCAAQ